jgi:prevent-host-death family protein
VLAFYSRLLKEKILMITIGVNALQKNLIDFLERVEAGESITITRQGYQVAKLVPCDQKRERARAALQEFRKTAVVGDIVSSLDEEWEALE